MLAAGALIVTRRYAWLFGLVLLPVILSLVLYLGRCILIFVQALTLDQVLRGACLGPALAEGSGDRGRLTVGQRADLVVVPAAGLAAPIEPGGPLATTRPRLVLIGGRVAFEA